MKVLVTGATGLIGKKLIHALLTEGHQVKALARSPSKLPELPENQIFMWTDDQLVPQEALTDCDAIVHLAGEGIADKRWTDERKKRIWNSRVDGTNNLVDSIKKLKIDKRPKILISGSAIGIYQDSNEAQDENSSYGNGFLPELCIEWEKSALKSEKLGLRTVLLRTGLVLAEEGGLLEKTAPIILGSGKQWMSWIHIDDYVQFVLKALKTNSMSGPFNLTAPHPVTNEEFTKVYAKAKGIPLTIPAPEAVLKLALGEMSQAVLSNQKVVPKKMLESGFKFEYEFINEAMKDLVGSRKLTENLFTAAQFVPLKRKQVFSFFLKLKI